jgi:hypothetical protein
MIRPGLLTASTSKAAHFGMSADCLWFSNCRCSFSVLLWFGVLALKTGFPPRRDVGYDWALDRAHLWRNGVEHLERSAELRGRAVVDNENEQGN